MGLLDWLVGSYDVDKDHASRRLAKLRSRCDCKYERGTDEYDKWMGDELKLEISSTNLQGGKRMHKRAVAMWQLYRALYPKHITDKEYPKLTKKAWLNPDPQNPPNLSE